MTGSGSLIDMSDLWARSCLTPAKRYEWPEFLLILDPTLKGKPNPDHEITLEELLTVAAHPEDQPKFERGGEWWRE